MYLKMKHSIQFQIASTVMSADFLLLRLKTSSWITSQKVSSCWAGNYFFFFIEIFRKDSLLVSDLVAWNLKWGYEISVHLRLIALSKINTIEHGAFKQCVTDDNEFLSFSCYFPEDFYECGVGCPSIIPDLHLHKSNPWTLLLNIDSGFRREWDKWKREISVINNYTLISSLLVSLLSSDERSKS